MTVGELISQLEKAQTYGAQVLVEVKGDKPGGSSVHHIDRVSADTGSVLVLETR